MGINPQLNMANMVAMQGRNTNMFTQGSFTPSPTTVSSKCCIIQYLSRITTKPVFRVFDQVKYKPCCTATEDG